MANLIEICKQIKRVFKEAVQELILEYNDYPECVCIIIKTNLSPKDSLDLLDKFDKEYWLNVDDNTNKSIEVMVRPI